MIYYNENNRKAAAALKQLIVDGLLPDGWVDDRSILEVKAEEIKGFEQAHFFAGIGGWPLALQMAGWIGPVWTGSCPCQPFSQAGQQKGTNDERHLWPIWFKLIKECHPPVIFGEQVAAAIAHGWLDGVFNDMESENYACGAAVLPACSVNAPHRRERLWFVGNAQRNGLNGSEELRSIGESEVEGGLFQPQGSDSSSGELGNSQCSGLEGFSGTEDGASGRENGGGSTSSSSFWSDADWITCGDGKNRRTPPIESGICLLGNGFSERVGLLSAAGNAIVPQVAAEFIKATMRTL